MAWLTGMVPCCCRQDPPEAAALTVAADTTSPEVLAAPAFRLAAGGLEARPLEMVETAAVFRLAAVDAAAGLLVEGLRAHQGTTATVRLGLCLTASARMGGCPADLAATGAGMTLTGLTPTRPPMKRQRGDMLISSI